MQCIVVCNVNTLLKDSTKRYVANGLCRGFERNIRIIFLLLLLCETTISLERRVQSSDCAKKERETGIKNFGFLHL